jgi:LysR family hydrogen peroxide-inducible transcriptional activator
MDVKQLRALVAVGEHRSFSAAARALHTVQSNISTHVSRLEREMGVVLVDRATTALTEEGMIVAERARRIEAEFGALESDVASLRDEVRGNVKVGVIGTTARWLVPLLLEELHARHPAIRVVVLDATTSSLIPQLVTGPIDLAVLNLPVSDPDVTVEPLFDEDLILVAPGGHALYGRDSVGLAELADHELLLPERGTGFRDDLDDDAATAGIELRAKAEFDGMRLLASLAFAGFGAAILPASAAPATVGGDWKRLRLTGASGRSVGLGRRRRGLPSAAERAVADVAREVVRRSGPDQPGIHPVRPAPGVAPGERRV